MWSDEKDRGLTANVTVDNGNGRYIVNQEQPFDDYLEVILSGGFTIIPKTRNNFMGLEFFFTANNLFNHRGALQYSAPNSAFAYYGGFDIGRFMYMRYTQRF